MNKVCLLILLSIVMVAPARAQAPGSEAFRRFEIGWNVISYARHADSNLGGGGLSFAVRASPRLGFVADLDVHVAGDDDDVEFTITNYRFGPRLYGPTRGRITPFAEILAGGTRTTTSFVTVFPGGRTTTDFSLNGFAFAAGGGLDMRIKRWIAWRAVQADYNFLRVRGENSNGVRLATGIVFRFGS
jgi:hypothetical protein